MKALILAAGYATRLYPLTKDFPKPLLKVGKKPIIDYLIDKLEKAESVGEVIVVTNDKFLAIFKKWAYSKRIGKKITVISDGTTYEDDRLGSIGDISFVIKNRKLNCDLLILGGDNLFDSRLDGFLSFSAKLKDSAIVGLYDIGDINDAHHYGVAKINGKNRVVDFQEKSQRPKSTLVAMCLYFFPRAKLSLVGEYLRHKTNKHDASGYYISWLSRKTKVYGYVFTGRWYDIGHHRFYADAKKKFKSE